MVILENVPLAPLTSWLIGGPAEFFCQPINIQEIQQAQAWAKARSLPVEILSGGSNVLISDQGVRGLVLCLKSFNKVEILLSPERVELTCEAGVGKSDLLKIYLKQKLAPALFLAGIPGDVGGGIVMNAGVSEDMKPREFTEITSWIEVLKEDGSLRRYQHDQVQWSYRHCMGWQPGIIVRAGLVCPNQPDPAILDKVRAANKVRLSKQPLDLPSCGSVFQNPPGHKAAQLIDQCELKGLQVGQAQVSNKHANFIVNLGGATALDTWTLMMKVQTTVKQHKGVDLKTEVVRMGTWE